MKAVFIGAVTVLVCVLLVLKKEYRRQVIAGYLITVILFSAFYNYRFAGTIVDFYRPTDVVNLWGDPSKAKRELGWNPTKTSFEELVRIMVDYDMKKVAVERAEEHIRTNLAEYLEKGVVK